MSNYPLGAANNPAAPYNKEDLLMEEIEVTVVLCINKTVKIKVNDYNVREEGLDEDGHYFKDIDYSTCDLTTAVKQQVDLPIDVDSLNPDWHVDEFAVIYE